MIKKERTRPLIIDCLEALISRLPSNHPKIPLLESDLTKYKKGHRGEKANDYYLNLLPKKDYYIFHGLRLPDGENFFQIDTLIATPYFILISEVKNISGTLTFEVDSKQMIRKLNEEEEGMLNPILQVERHKLQLMRFFQLYKIPKIPIESLVIISDPRTITKASNPSVYKKVKQSADIPFIIEKLSQKYSKVCLSPKDLNRMTKQLIKSHTVKIPEVLKKYSIEVSEILTGVQCLECGSLPMERVEGKWFCRQCGAKSRHAHVKAIREYALIFGQSITNKQLRNFLHTPSSSISKKILTSMNLEYHGTTKDRVYMIPLNEGI
ncbi:nuclease-related domain-containing protein [Fredinandcohnia quinoae]|uniref:NERD domain-containing protein n=1 Tax=Fredinandcohnia quinoae TaxID=2918902 RepID=A0AAW5EDH5_9BACI|nr:nuclease-related domain-containing protein [Fredinandcohnia sp. SECRCQ15]MCH1627775.1 NERD domain-containing protein [Fredinandcohnia sp. SECRCQ15]